MAWVSSPYLPDAAVHLIHLATREQQVLGAADYIYGWLDTRTLVLRIENEQYFTLDIESGDREPFEAGDEVPFAAQGDLALYVQPGTRDGLTSTIEVRDSAGLIRLEREVLRATFAGPGEVLVVEETAEEAALRIAIVTIATGAEQVIGTAYTDEPSMPPFTATGDAVLWTDRDCAGQPSGSPVPGTMRLYDRKRGEITDIQPALHAVLTPDGRLGVGELYQPRALFNLDTHEYETVLPEGMLYSSWSPDYRYASTGAVGGHGSAPFGFVCD